MTLKPLLKWPGGKRRLAPRIAEALALTPLQTYYEPFCGGLAVFLYLREHGWEGKAYLNDVNKRLINFYRVVRNAPAQLFLATHYYFKKGREDYYEIRNRFNSGSQRPEMNAASMLYLNRHCYNGLYRENSKGGFNVAKGRHKTIRVPTLEEIKAVSRALQNTVLTAYSYDSPLWAVGDGDAAYVDPPYIPIPGQKTNFTTYSARRWTDADDRRLAEDCRQAHLRGARVVVSNHDLPVVRKLYEGFSVYWSGDVRRSVSRSKREKVGEVILVS